MRWLKILACLLTFSFSLFLYIDKLNVQNELKLKIPQLEKEVKELEQQTIELAFQVENFKDPQHLLELAQQPAYSHLKFPYMEEVMVISPQIAQRGLQKNEELNAAVR